MAVIGKEQIAAAQDLRFEMVPVPEWGGDARMQELSAEGWALFASWGEPLRRDDAEKDVKTILGYRERIVALSLSNEDGSLVYPDWDEGIAALSKRKPEVLDRLADVTLRISGIAPDAVEKTASDPNSPSGSAS